MLNLKYINKQKFFNQEVYKSKIRKYGKVNMLVDGKDNQKLDNKTGENASHKKNI